MKNAEIVALSIEDLKSRIAAEELNKQNLRFAHSISPLENPGKITQTRRLVAKLKSELRRRQLNASLND